MNPDEVQRATVDIKDLLLFLLRRIGIIILVAVIIGATVAFYTYRTTAADISVLDTSVKLDGETDIQYKKRINDVQHAYDIIASIDATNAIINSHTKYIDNSYLMKIDASNEAVSAAQFAFIIDDAETNGIDRTLATAYSNLVKSGDCLESVANEMGTEPQYLLELISISVIYPNNTILSVGDSEFDTALGLNITVIGSDTDYTEKILNAVIDEINGHYEDFNATIVHHELILSVSQSYYTSDIDTANDQAAVVKNIDALNKQITAYNTSLDDIATELGISNTSALYEEVHSTGIVSPVKAIKTGIAGVLGGALITAVVISVMYIFGNRIVTQARFKSKFPGIYIIGIMKPEKDAKGYAGFVNKLSGDDNALSSEINNKLIAANLYNLTSSSEKVLIVGTIGEEAIKAAFDELKAVGDIKGSIFDYPEILERVNDYDYVVIVEKRHVSQIKLIREEIELLGNSKTELIGTILL